MTEGSVVLPPQKIGEHMATGQHYWGKTAETRDDFMKTLTAAKAAGASLRITLEDGTYLITPYLIKMTDHGVEFPSRLDINTRIKIEWTRIASIGAL